MLYTYLQAQEAEANESAGAEAAAQTMAVGQTFQTSQIEHDKPPVPKPQVNTVREANQGTGKMRIVRKLHGIEQRSCLMCTHAIFELCAF